MRIKDIGGERALIERIARKKKDKDVVVGIGDDAAVVKWGKERLVITTDMFVEGDHFSRGYFSARNTGWKAMEANVSDLAAMGAKPKYALVSMALTSNTSVEFVEEMYKGLRASAKRHGIEIIGGDTTHGGKIVVSITLLGKAGKRLPLRNNAKAGDLIFVTGKLGGSTAGLYLFQKKLKGFKKVKEKHIKPKAQSGKGLKIAAFANACEDVSDGLASEVKNICKASKCGAVLYYEKIPVAKETEQAAKRLGKNAKDLALFGGEDFELVFSCRKRQEKSANSWTRSWGNH